MNLTDNTPSAPDGGNPKSGWFTRKIYETDAEKKKDFWIGVGLFFGLNILLFLCGWGALVLLAGSGTTFDSSSWMSGNLYTVLSCVLQLLPWVINFGFIIYFTFTRSQIALGMVAGFGIALAISICLGVIFAVWCFIALSGGNF